MQLLPRRKTSFPIKRKFGVDNETSEVFTSKLSGQAMLHYVESLERIHLSLQ